MGCAMRPHDRGSYWKHRSMARVPAQSLNSCCPFSGVDHPQHTKLLLSQMRRPRKHALLLFADHPRYTKLRDLNSGGFGFVQLCRDAAYGRQVPSRPHHAAGPLSQLCMTQARSRLHTVRTLLLSLHCLMLEGRICTPVQAVAGQQALVALQTGFGAGCCRWRSSL